MTKLLFILLFLFGCSPTEPENVHGCLDSQACNYNSDATIDNNSCWYSNEGCDCNDGQDAVLDECDECGGDNSSCTDCNDNINGDYVIDECGNCYPSSYLSYNCNDIQVLQDIIDSNAFYQSELPLEIADAMVWEDSRLKELNIGVDGDGSDGDGISILPNSIENLTQLTHLHIQSLVFQSLPESISNMQSLEFIGISARLTEIPESIENLINLESLHLCENNLTSLPESIGNLTNLNTLSLCNNNLTSLPESIGNLNINILDLDNNELTSLPESIGDLSNLLDLYLDDNQLTTLPESIGNLSVLNRLYVENNQLTSLPSTICNLQTHCDIYIPNNNLCEEYNYDCIDTFHPQDCQD